MRAIEGYYDGGFDEAKEAELQKGLTAGNYRDFLCDYDSKTGRRTFTMFVDDIDISRTTSSITTIGCTVIRSDQTKEEYEARARGINL